MGIPLNIDWQQILLHLFNFAILALGLYLLLYKPVKDFMKKRDEHYRHVEEEVNNRLSEAESMKAQWESQIENAENEIAEKRSAARIELSKMKDQEVQKTKMQCEKLLEEARTSGELEKEKLRKEAQKEVEQLTVRAMERLMKTSDQDALETFLQEQ